MARTDELRGLPKRYIATLIALNLTTRASVKDAEETGLLARLRGIGPGALRAIRGWLGMPEAHIQCPHCGGEVVVALQKVE